MEVVMKMELGSHASVDPEVTALCLELLPSVDVAVAETPVAVMIVPGVVMTCPMAAASLSAATAAAAAAATVALTVCRSSPAARGGDF